MSRTKKEVLRYHDERQSIVDACVDLSHRGFLAGVGGNVALRLSETEFAVTPSAADYYTMQARDICLLDLNTLKRVDQDNSLTPSVESGLHAQLLNRRPDLSASVHTHQPLASAVALLHMPIPLNSGDQQRLGKQVALVGYGPSGSKLLVSALRRALRSDTNAYLLRNHGLVCAAETLEQALEGVQRIEKASARYLLDMIRQTRISPLSPVLLQRIESMLGSAITEEYI